MFFYILLSTLTLILLKLLSDHQNYFKDRKIPYLKSIPLLGAFGDYVLQRKNFFDCVFDIYNNEKLKDEKFFGIFLFHKPALLIKDPKLIKNIFVKDANLFTDRMVTTDEKDPFHSNLITAKNPDWSRIRKKVSPIFTSAKLKSAFCHIDEIAKLLAVHLNEKVQKGETEMVPKETMELYTIDAISNIFFGFNPKSLEGNYDELHEVLHSMTRLTIRRTVEFMAGVMLPFLYKIFELGFFGLNFTSFIRRLIPRAMDEREQSGLKRNDFLDMLLEMRKNRELTEDEICAQAGAFMIAGLHTSSLMLSFVTYELALNPKIQQKLRDEIRKYFDENEEISYEAVAHQNLLPYLDCVVNEILRKYSVVPHLDRVCTAPDGYQLENFKVPYGMPVVVPIHALSHDEKYFKDPWTFKPERFEKEIQQGTFLAFGMGGRSCIGERLAVIMIKTAVMRVLKDFRVEECEKTIKNFKIHKRAFAVQPEIEIIVKIAKE